MGDKTNLNHRYYEAGENSGSFCEVNDFTEWMDKHSDEVYNLTGVENNLWIDWFNDCIDADLWIELQLENDPEYYELDPKGKDAYFNELTDVLKNKYLTDKHGLRGIVRKQSDADQPLLDLVKQFAINRLQVISTDSHSKKYVLRFLNDFAFKKGLDFKIIDASQATVEDIRGKIDSMEIDGMIYTHHNPPEYWPQQKSLIVVEGLDRAEDWSTLCNAFMYVAYSANRGPEYLKCDQLPEGSGFVVLSHNGLPALWISIFGWNNSYVVWPTLLSSKERIVYETAVALQDVRGFYCAGFINQWRKTRDESELFTEIVSAELLEIDFPTALKTKFNNYVPYNISRPEIKYITRRRRITPDKPAKKALCLNLCRDGADARRLGPLGTVIDCQVSVKYPQTKYTGAIDLVTLKSDTIWLLSVKDSENTDTLLAALLEITTFDDMLDYDNFLASREIKMLDKPVFQKGVLICQDSLQQVELAAMEKGERPNISKLAQALGVSFFLLLENDGQYVIDKINI